MASVSNNISYKKVNVYISFSCSYYLNGAKAVLPDMFNVAVLDSFINEAKEAKSYAFKYLPKAELWLGETSSCYGGGTPVLSSSFVSGFMCV